ncbi:hypothetical protein L210DRAFT_985535 [Boletus edulis BED1]|uniref:Uncharacterized protein n=1 Tax=Boletus edulis BED1 TaxID=1328754 RepID=A0AAD4BWI6_BOLED|nr:hypothetical protein L210DRAFT_985535 [Boletus edulis BED1]
MTDTHSKKPVSHDEPKANTTLSASTNPSVSTINAPISDSNAISFPTSMTDTHSKKPISYDEPKANMILSASTTNPSISTINAPVSDSNTINITPSKLPPNIPAPLDTTTSASTTNMSISHAGNVIAPSLLPNVPASSSLNIQNSTTADVPSTDLTAKVPAAPSTRKVRMRPGPARTGRNLTALRWLKQIQSDGTTPAFKDYYGGLSKDQRQAYDNEARDLVAKNIWNKAKDVQDGTLH